MTDEDETPTVFDRLIAAGLAQERAEWHLGAGRVELDGVVVTDPYAPGAAPVPAGDHRAVATLLAAPSPGRR